MCGRRRSHRPIPSVSHDSDLSWSSLALLKFLKLKIGDELA